MKEEGFYFTPDKDIALYHSSYAKRRYQLNSAFLIQLRVPNSAIESLSETELQRVYYPSPEWKALVLYSRQWNKYPAELQKFKEAKLIIGTISTAPQAFYYKLKSPEEITVRMLLKGRDERLAIQYAWRGDWGQEFLEEHGQFRAFPLTTMDYTRWYRRTEESEDVELLNI